MSRMRIIKSYKILHEKDRFLLEIQVRRAIDNGWKPQGGISTCVMGSDMYFTQAIKETHKEG